MAEVSKLYYNVFIEQNCHYQADSQNKYLQ